MPAINWTPELITKLAHTARNHTIRETALAMGLTYETTQIKLKELGIKPKRAKWHSLYPQRLSSKTPITFPTFEDHPDGDKDRHMGRRPQREYAQSLTGCAAMECMG